MAASMTPAELRRRYQQGGEIAIVDAREEGSFHQCHLWMASCLPLSRLELLAARLLPRRGAPVVVCDLDGGELAARAAARLEAGGWRDVAILEGGVRAWQAAGFPVYSGVHVPSKAFAEVVEHEMGTPWITAEELAQRQGRGDDMVVFDSRSFEEFRTNSIPGAISVPGAELVYRFADLVPSAETFVVVNCGGRTRSIIGAQALIDAEVPNKVVSLQNGTMAWHLAGFEVVRGADRRAPAVSAAGLAAARRRAEAVAARWAVPVIDRATLDAWRGESDRRTLYVLDVRDPAEYAAAHMPGSVGVAGGQLVQETDSWLGIWGARVVLVDDTGVRARMTASWLKRMGWEVAVLDRGLDGSALETGVPQADPGMFPLAGPEPETIAPAELAGLSGITIIDLALSRRHRDGHIPGACFAVRARLAEALGQVPEGEIILTSEDGVLARFAAAEIAGRRIRALAGGTAAWQATGLPLATGMGRLLSEPDDVSVSARDRPAERERYMREYLAWEIDLVNQAAGDPDCRFALTPVS